MGLPFWWRFLMGFFGRWSSRFGRIGYGLDRSGIPEVCIRFGLGGEVAAEERNEVQRWWRIGEAVPVREQVFEGRHFCELRAKSLFNT